MDELFKEELRILEQERVILFHGTSYISFLNIKEKGIMPVPPEPYVYLTSLEEIAIKYARFAVARSKFEGKQPVNEGVILKIEVNGKDLEHDRFNLLEEPFQYKTKKTIIYSQIQKVNFVDFGELENQVELLETVSAFFGSVDKAYAFYKDRNK